MRAITLLLFLAFSPPLLAIFDRWEDVPHEATQANLWSIASGDRTLIAVGEQGTILSFNYDDRAWLPRASGTAHWLVGVGYGAGRFVAVGDRGTILTSDDRGVTWIPRVSGTTIRLNAVAHGDNLWLAVGEQGTVLTSPDGLTWSSRPRLGDGTQFLRALAFGQGRFLVGGARGLLFTTTDGTTFTPIALATSADIEAAAITTSRFFVVGSNGLRADATQLDHWSIHHRPGETYRGATVRNLQEVSAVGDGVGETFTLSQPGATGTWTPALPPPRFLATAAALGLDEVVAVGFGGRIARTFVSTILPTIVSDSRPEVIQGSDVRFSLITDREILAYQWFKVGNLPGATLDLPGATAPELHLRNVTAADSGTYGVRLTTATPDGVLTRTTTPLRVIPAGAPDPRDPTFSPQLPAIPTHVVPLPDGKILVAGQFNLRAGDLRPYRLLRLNADGSLDPTFRSGSDAPTFPALGSLRVTSDNKIYVYPPSPNPEVPSAPPLFPIQRLLPDGQLDPAPIEPGSAPPPPVAATASGTTTRFETPTATYSATASRTPATSNLSFSSTLPGYTSPPPSPTPWWAGFSYGFRPDGALWQVRSDFALPSLMWPFRATLYDPTGRLDPTAYATLPDQRLYNIRAVASDGAIYAVADNASTPAAPSLIRIRPIVGRPARLTNLSIRTSVPTDSAGSPLLVGFVTAGTGETRALLRAVGPSLAAYNITDALPDPTLSVQLANTIIAANDQWPAALASRFAALGAFPLAADTRDAALETTLGPGDHVALVSPASSSAAGTALLELYESAAPDTPRRFVNLSARGTVAANRPLIAGFTLSGDVPVRLLIRGIGPSLAPFGIPNALADPRLTLFRADQPLYANDNWSANNPTLFTSQAGTGAFPLPIGSRDAAMLVTLAPGSYTAVIEATDNSTGAALIELYEIP